MFVEHLFLLEDVFHLNMCLICLSIRAEIDKLEKEREELDKDLRLIESSSNQSKNDKLCENLNQLGRKKRMYLFDLAFWDLLETI